MLYSGDNSVEYAIQITICEGCLVHTYHACTCPFIEVLT